MEASLTAAEPATPAGSAKRARLAWREWRRTRPFWGGLLITTGGIEILSTAVVSLGPTLRVGLGGVDGFVGIVIAFVLAVCGLLLWFSPAQRPFYSIVAMVLALASFNTLNYGGFFIGMLLGIIGGALGFAWTPATVHRRTARSERTRPRAAAGALSLALARLRSSRNGRSPQASSGEGSGQANRVQGLAALSLGLLLLGAGLPAARPAAASAPGGSGSSGASGCILFILCPPPKPPPAGSPGPSAPPVPGGSTGSTAPGGSAGSAPRHGKIKRTTATRGLVAATVPAVLTAGSAQLVGLGYDGVAEVPTASGPPVQMMKFSLRSVTLTGKPTLTIKQNASTAVTSTSVLSFTGNVVLYATKLSGDLLGVPVTLTPSSPLSLVLQLLKPLTEGLTVTMTHVVTNQPLTTSVASRWSSFLISVRPGT